MATSWISPLYKEMIHTFNTAFIAVAAYIIFSRSDHGKFLNSQLSPNERVENAKTIRNIVYTSSIVIQKLKMVSIMLKNPGNDLKTTLNATQANLIINLNKMGKELDKLEKKLIINNKRRMVNIYHPSFIIYLVYHPN